MSIRQILTCVLVVSAVLAAQLGAPTWQPTLQPASGPLSRSLEDAAFGQLPLQFEVNRGQADAAARFLARGLGYNLLLTPHEVVLGLASSAVRLQFVGAAPEPRLLGLDRLAGVVNYYLGLDWAQGHSGIPTYARVKYEGLYPGIDAVFYGRQQELEHDFVVAPGRDPSAIALRVQGTDRLQIDPAGDLILSAAGSQLRLLKPTIYQEQNGVRQAVGGGYALRGEGQFGFQVAAYDASRPLIIDPVLDYSSYFGGDGDDYAYAVAVDSAGDFYVTGATNSTNFPVLNAAQGAFGGGGVDCPDDLPTRVCYDAFVTKIAAAGDAILYSTYLGLPGEDEGRAIAVDPAGNAYVTGQLSMPGEPPLDELYLYHYALVAKLGPTGELIYGGNFGNEGSGVMGLGIAADSEGRAYVTGEVANAAIPITAGAIQPAKEGMQDAFVAVIDPAGYLLYSTYLGGNGTPCEQCSSSGRGIAVDSSGYIYVTGQAGPSFPVTGNAYQTEFRGFWQAFVVKIDRTQAGAAGLVYSSLFGGSQTEMGFGIALDSSGKVYITGPAKSDDLPTTVGAYDRTCGTDGLCNPTTVCWGGFPPICETKPQEDVFVAKFDLTQSGAASLLFSTYVGGSGRDEGSAIAVDAAGTAYVTGFTVSPDFPTVSPLQATFGGQRDAVVLELSSSGSQLTYSTYMGGGSDDEGNGIAVDSSGHVYVTGYTGSGAFPIANPLRPRSGGWEAFIARFGPSTAAPTGLGAAVASQTQVNLSWTDNSNDESGFHVERSPDGSTGWTEVGTTGPNVTSYSSTGLSCGTTYHYRVRARHQDDGQYSAYSNVVSVTTQDCTFGKTTPTNGAAGISTSPTLYWVANASATGYTYCVDTVNNAACDAAWTSVGTATSVALSGLAGTTTYYWQVRAVGATTTDADSGAWWSFTTRADIPGLTPRLFLPLVIR